MLNKVIRKISVGSDVNNQLHVAVGSTIGGSMVSAIAEIKPKTYEVWIFMNGTKDVSAWKKFEDMPVIVEYNTRLD